MLEQIMSNKALDVMQRGMGAVCMVRRALVVGAGMLAVGLGA